jgi:hypothetical protein
MREIMDAVFTGQNLMRTRLEKVKNTGGLTEERYVRLMTMQYHLTKGVQNVFYKIAAQTDVGQKPGLRKFLVQFGNEEEFHFEIAKQDLRNMGREPLDCPLDVKVWWTYYNSILETNPYLRLGATCILENLTDPSRDLIKELLAQAKFLNEKNTRFLVIHQHEKLPHGEQILEALETAQIAKDPKAYADLVQGAKDALTLYFRLIDWAFFNT